MENTESSLKFTEAENKIRKRWLFLTTLLPATILALIIIASIVSVFYSLEMLALLGIVLVVALIFSGSLYLNYYCAYKNPGTILLLLMTIGSSLNVLVTLFNPDNHIQMKESFFFSFLILLTLIFDASVIYYSYRLRQINKKMKERRLTSSPVFVNALSVFSTASNIDELNELFAKLRNSQKTEGKGVEALAKAYDQQKKILSLAKNSL